MEQGNEVNVEETSGDTLDIPSGESNTEQTTESVPVVPQIDFASLYRESVAERNRLQAEADSLRSQRNAPAPVQEEEITDEHLEKFGTTATIKKLVAQSIRQELKESLADVGQFSQDYKRSKQTDQAEAAFFQQFPQLSGVRDGLSQIVRQTLQNSPHIDPTTYNNVALNAIALYQINALSQQQNTPAPVNNSRPSAPTPRTGGTPTATAGPRINEIERNAMRKAGFDPNKRDDYDAFMKIVNNDEGITV
jgi:hypothetical protein